MKILRLVLLTLLALLGNSRVCFAKDFLLVASPQFITGNPDAIYSVNPGANASVAVATSTVLYCKNRFSTNKIAYLSWGLDAWLQTSPGNVVVFSGATVSGTTVSLTAGQVWQPTPLLLSTSGLAAIGLYNAKGRSSLSEDKTGDEAVTNISTPVTVQPYA